MEAISQSNSKERFHYEMTSGVPPTGIPLPKFMEHFEELADKHLEGVRKRREKESWQQDYDILYIAEIKTKPIQAQPESLIATLWEECLGAHAIPFNAMDRQSLVDRGREHTELRRHIDTWEEMKRTGSKWVSETAEDNSP